MSKYAFTATLAVLALSATVLIAASAPGNKKLTVLIDAQASAPSPGACVAVTYPLRCPSLNCSCVMYTGSFSGTLGRGNLANMELTIDNGDATPAGNCAPALGVISFPAGKRFGAIMLDVAGAICNSTPKGGNDTIGGGFDVDPMTSGVAGTGAMAGAQAPDGTARIKLSGELAPSGSMMAPSSSATATATASFAPSSTASPTASPTSTGLLGLGL